MALFKHRGELQTQSLSNLVRREGDRGGRDDGREAEDESSLPVWLPSLLVQGPTGWGGHFFFSKGEQSEAGLVKGALGGISWALCLKWGHSSG